MKTWSPISEKAVGFSLKFRSPVEASAVVKSVGCVISIKFGLSIALSKVQDRPQTASVSVDTHYGSIMVSDSLNTTVDGLET